MSPDNSAPIKTAYPLSRCIRFSFVLAIVGLLILASFRLNDALRHGLLDEIHAGVDLLREKNALAVLAVAFLAHTSIAACATPVSGAVLLFYGWYFPFWQALLLVSISSPLGATLCLLLSRYFFRDYIQRRFATKLAHINDALAVEGPFYLFILRLAPIVPAFTVNVLMGVSPIPARTFYCVSLLGMLPGTIAFLYSGSQLPDLKAVQNQTVSEVISPSLVIAFAVIALMPFAMRKVLQRYRPTA